MLTLQRRSSALAAAAVMTATLLVGPFTQEVGAQPRRSAKPSATRRASRSGFRSGRVRGAPSGDIWARLRHCESGGRYDRNSGNGFYGAYQFLPSTWRGLGLRGLPHEAPPEVQDAAARRLQTRSGWAQWPVCSRRIGAR
jgi:hypothetical protein